MQAALQQQAAQLQADAAKHLEAVTAAHAAEVQQLRQSADAQLWQQLRQHEEAMATLRDSHKQALLQQQEAHAAELHAAAAKAARDAEALQAAAAGSQSEVEQHLRFVGAGEGAGIEVGLHRHVLNPPACMACVCTLAVLLHLRSYT